MCESLILITRPQTNTLRGATLRNRWASHSRAEPSQLHPLSQWRNLDKYLGGRRLNERVIFLPVSCPSGCVRSLALSSVRAVRAVMGSQILSPPDDGSGPSDVMCAGLDGVPSPGGPREVRIVATSKYKHKQKHTRNLPELAGHVLSSRLVSSPARRESYGSNLAEDNRLQNFKVGNNLPTSTSSQGSARNDTHARDFLWPCGICASLSPPGSSSTDREAATSRSSSLSLS